MAIRTLAGTQEMLFQAVLILLRLDGYADPTTLLLWNTQRRGQWNIEATVTSV